VRFGPKGLGCRVQGVVFRVESWGFSKQASGLGFKG